MDNARAGVPAVKKRSKVGKFLSDNKCMLYILPWLIGFLIFKAGPMLQSLYYSFTDYILFKDIDWVGLDNYKYIFTNKNSLKSLGVTVKYVFMTVPLKLAFALFIAFVLNFKVKFVNGFRTIYYIPSILGGSVAIAVLWKALFRDEGLINTVLGIFGIDGPNWLADPSYALFIICLLRVWQFGSAMVLFLAALKGVPQDLYEAADIDGASKTRQFFSITIPLISPIIFFNFITQLCQAFQEFNGPFIITSGGPRKATTLFSLLIYNEAFKSLEMGLASAMAWVMFIILTIFTVISFVSQKYWVFYSDEKGD